MALKKLQDDKGFSLIEILIGVAVFSLGMLGLIALQVSSIKSTRFAANMGEGMNLASSKIEELMLADYDDTDLDDDNVVGGDGLAGLDWNCHQLVPETCPANEDSDGFEVLGGWNGKYVLYWNVVENNPVTNTKTINMIISWRVKESEGGRQQVSFTTVRAKEL